MLWCSLVGHASAAHAGVAPAHQHCRGAYDEPRRMQERRAHAAFASVSRRFRQRHRAKDESAAQKAPHQPLAR